MIKKFLQWLWKLFMDDVKALALDTIDEDANIIFPDAETLRKETLENTPFITDKQILKEIRNAQKEHDNYACVYGFRISDERIAKLEKSGISVEILTDSVGFKLKWYS